MDDKNGLILQQPLVAFFYALYPLALLLYIDTDGVCEATRYVSVSIRCSVAASCTSADSMGAYAGTKVSMAASCASADSMGASSGTRVSMAASCTSVGSMRASEGTRVTVAASALL
jgi:hypothetical protein